MAEKGQAQEKDLANAGTRGGQEENDKSASQPKVTEEEKTVVQDSFEDKDLQERAGKDKSSSDIFPADPDEAEGGEREVKQDASAKDRQREAEKGLTGDEVQAKKDNSSRLANTDETPASESLEAEVEEVEKTPAKKQQRGAVGVSGEVALSDDAPQERGGEASEISGNAESAKASKDSNLSEEQPQDDTGAGEEKATDTETVVQESVESKGTSPDQSKNAKQSKREQLRARLAAKKKAKALEQQEPTEESSIEMEGDKELTQESEEVEETPTMPLQDSERKKKQASEDRKNPVPRSTTSFESQNKNISYFDSPDFVESVSVYERGLRHLYDRYRCAQVVTGRFVTFSEISSKWSLINFPELFRLCKDFGIVHAKGLGRQELKRIFIVCTDPKGNMQALTFEQFRKFLALCGDELLTSDRWKEKYPTVQSRVNALFFHMGLSEDKKCERNKRMRAFGGFMYGDGMLGGHDEVSLDRAGKSPFQSHDYTKGGVPTHTILTSIESHEAEQEGDAELHPHGAPLRTDKRIHNPFSLSLEEEQDILHKCGLAEPEETKEETKRKAHWQSVHALNVSDLFSFKLPPKPKPQPLPSADRPCSPAGEPCQPATIDASTSKSPRTRGSSPPATARSNLAQQQSLRQSTKKASPSASRLGKSRIGKKLTKGETSRSRKFLNKLQQAKARRNHGAKKRPPPSRTSPSASSHGYASAIHTSVSSKPHPRSHTQRKLRQRSPVSRQPSNARSSSKPRSYLKPVIPKAAPKSATSLVVPQQAPGYHAPPAPGTGVYTPTGISMPAMPGMMPGAPYMPFYTAMPYGAIPMSQPFVYPQPIAANYAWAAQGVQQPGVTTPQRGGYTGG